MTIRQKLGILLLVVIILALAACGEANNSTQPAVSGAILVITTTPQTTPNTPAWTATASPSPTADITIPPERTATASPASTAAATVTYQPPPATAVWDDQPMPLLPAGEEMSIDEIHMIDAANGWAIMDRVILGEVEEKGNAIFEFESVPQDHILRTTDGGRTWQDVSPPELVRISKFAGNTYYREFKYATAFFLDAETAWVAFSSFEHNFFEPNHIWHTTNGGRTWEKADLLWPDGAQTEASSGCGAELSFLDQRYGWYQISFCRNTTAIYRTTDGGASWALIGNSYDQPVPNLVSFIDRQHGWGIQNASYGYGFAHFRTQDGGLSWEHQGMLWPDRFLDSEKANEKGFSSCEASAFELIAPQSGRIIVRCDALRGGHSRRSYYLYESSDDGASWQVSPLPAGRVDFVSPRMGWALDYGEPRPHFMTEELPQLIRTDDGGLTWQPVSPLAWDGPFDFINTQTGWALDQTSVPPTLLLTHDGGRTWQPISPHLVDSSLPLPRPAPPRPNLPEIETLSPLTTDNLNQMQRLDELPAENATNLAASEVSYHIQIAVSYTDGRLGLWDTGLGGYGIDYPVILPWHTGWVYKPAFNSGETSRDLPYFVTASKDGTAKSYYLPRLSADGPSEGPTVDGHAGEITTVALYNKLLATGSEDKTIKIWDFGDFRWDRDPDEEVPPRFTLEGHTDWVWDVAFSPDGRLLASASEDRTVRLWDVASGEALQVLDGHASTVWRVAFSPDGSLLASASWDGTVKIWDVPTGKEVRTLTGHSDWLYALAFSPDGALIASGSADGTVRLWEVETGRELRKLSIDGTAVRGVTFTADGKLLAAVSSGGRLVFWGVLPSSSPEETPTQTPGPEANQPSIAQTNELVLQAENALKVRNLDRAGQLILEALEGSDQQGGGTTARAGAIAYAILDKIESLETPLIGHSDRVRSAVFSPDGTKIVTASDDGTARLWTAEGKALAVLEGHTNMVNSGAFSPDGTKIVTAGDDGTARLWTAEGEALAVLEGHTDGVNSATFSLDGSMILTASMDGTARVWAVEGEELAVLRGHMSFVNLAVFSQDGSMVLTAGGDLKARVWTVEGDALAVIGSDTLWIEYAAFSPDGSKIVTAVRDGTARLWSVNGRRLAVLEGHTDTLHYAVFSPDGTKIVTGSSDDTARVWTAEGEMLAVLEGHTGWVYTAIFSQDGSKIVTTSWFESAWVWTVEGESLAVPGWDTHSIETAALSPDGTQVVTTSEDGAAQVWPVYSLEEMIALLR